MKQNVNKLVGRDENGDYYWLDYVFDDGNGFRGAVGSTFHPVSEAEKEKRMNPENAREHFRGLWQEAVKAGSTEESLDDYVQNLIDIDGIDAFFDLSYYDAGCKVAEIYNSEHSKDARPPEDLAEFSECTGGGRCFDYKIKWEKIYDKDALDLGLSYEKKT